MSTIDAVRELVEAPLTAEGYEIIDVEHGRGLLRITLDTDDGINLEGVTRATRIINALLDVHEDLVPGRYTLEVTSPGLERPLRTPAQYQRFVGTVVNVKTHARVDGERRLEGVLIAADDHGITVDDRRLAYDEIERARTVFEWGPTPKLGKSPKNPLKKKKAETS